jgi:outer membrane protein assembly factor BamB
MSGWGYSESPLVDGDKLVCTPGSDKAALVALNKTSGEVIWKSEIPECGGAGYASIVKAEVAGVPMYVTLLGRSKGLVGVDANTGKFLWNYAKMANGIANIPTPIVSDDLVFCSTGYGAGAALLRLKPTGSGEVKAEEVYFLEGRTFQNHHGGMALLDGYVYAGSGHNNGSPACVELQTGKVVWKKDRGPGTGSAAVLYADGNLIFRYQDGKVALIEASPQAYKEKGTFKIPEPSSSPSWQHPVIANGKLYLRDQDKMHCFNVKAGS